MSDLDKRLDEWEKRQQKAAEKNSDKEAEREKRRVEELSVAYLRRTGRDKK